MDRIPQYVFWIYGCSWRTCHLSPVSGQWKCRRLSAQATELPCKIIQRLPDIGHSKTNSYTGNSALEKIENLEI